MTWVSLLASLVLVLLLLLVQCLETTFAFQEPNTYQKLSRIASGDTRSTSRRRHEIIKLYENPIRFAGTGERTADMNQYNLPINEIETQWKATIVPKTIESDGGIFLGVQDDVNLFIDIVKVVLPRPPMDCGLGIELQEIAGGRGDGLGITLVSGFVVGGWIQKHCTERDIQLGDSIVSLSVMKRRGGGDTSSSSSIVSTLSSSGILVDTEETIQASTECLGYDATVDAIRSLPPAQSQDEKLLLTLKRLRRKPTLQVNLRYPPSQNEPDASIELFAGENLRLGMLARGVKLNDPLAKRFDTKSAGNCGAGGLCRTCAVGVLRGGDLLSPQKVAERQMLEDQPRWRLACKSFVGYGMEEGSITIQVNPRQW